MLKCFFVIVFSLLILASKCYAQTKIIKHLYYFEDSASFVYCGTIINVGIFYFVSDTSHNRRKENDFLLAMKCPEFFGADSFKRNNLYKVELSKNYTKIASHLSPTLLKSYKQQQNFYVVEAIKPE